jgi:hypothetical protein
MFLNLSISITMNYRQQWKIQNADARTARVKLYQRFCSHWSADLIRLSPWHAWTHPESMQIWSTPHHIHTSFQTHLFFMIMSLALVYLPRQYQKYCIMLIKYYLRHAYIYICDHVHHPLLFNDHAHQVQTISSSAFMTDYSFILRPKMFPHHFVDFAWLVPPCNLTMPYG